MGDILSRIFIRLFDYPLKKKPFCVHRQPTDKQADTEVKTDYDKFNDRFNKKLAERRKVIYENPRDNDVLLKVFPEWNETTISYLHSLFLTFCDDNNKMLDYKSFECILECLGDESVTDLRKKYFTVIDSDKDGFVNYVDFLHLVYNFQHSDSSYNLKGLCSKVAEKVMLINSLSIDKQLEYGLF